MLAIGIPIGDVVHEVHDPRERTEDREGGERPPHIRRVGQLTPEDHARKDDEVLGPLIRPQRNQQIEREGPGRHLTVRQ
jgi:hypothetical protein